MSPSAVNSLQADLLQWGERARRDLPWRRTRDPWAVLVSELMLQQTQVPRVVPKWHAFMARFPAPVECAEAGVGEVVRAWAGLGYNRRAVNLHRLAVEVVERHRGRLPDDLDALLALPGIGPYTARAVLVFAYEHDVGLIDTNAGRFVARALAGRSLDRREAQRVADLAVPAGRGWAWGQAVFDLGAKVCARRTPACGRCPVAMHCAWYQAGRPQPDPVDGSAGIRGPQSRFDGSDRQGRGRLVAALRARPVAPADVPVVAGWPADASRARRVAAGLVADGLAVADPDGTLRLPSNSTHYASPGAE
ncbi:MAG: A/G-specific adenine glycosylase [Acidimicrobiales bacterium]